MVKEQPGDIKFGPAILLDLMHNELKMIQGITSSADKAAMAAYRNIIKGAIPGDLDGKAVLTALQQTVLNKSV